MWMCRSLTVVKTFHSGWFLTVFMKSSELQKLVSQLSFQVYRTFVSTPVWTKRKQTDISSCIHTDLSPTYGTINKTNKQRRVKTCIPIPTPFFGWPNFCNYNYTTMTSDWLKVAHSNWFLTTLCCLERKSFSYPFPISWFLQQPTHIYCTD